MANIAEKLVFTFPGQGSFDVRLLKQLYESQRLSRKLFYAVDDAAGELLGVPFLPMVLAHGEAEPHADISRCPDLDQLGIYLADYATAHLWLQQGVTPDLLLGHSFGEFAAFAIAGIYGFEDGARIICQRVLSLRETAAQGRMAAIAAPQARVRAEIAQFATSTSVSVINNAGQTVVSGPQPELEELRDRFARQAVSVTMLKSRYPFHSPLLSPASRTFGIALRGYRFGKPLYPVFVGTEQRLVDSSMDLADVVARQLVTPLDFQAGLRSVITPGAWRFLECGAGTIVTKIVGSAINPDIAHREWATFPTAEEVDGRIPKIQPELSLPILPMRRGEDAADVAVTAPPRPEAAGIVPEATPFEPIAIVGMGCVFPGGVNGPQQFWEHICNGTGGIVDLTELDPNAREDFVAGKVDGAAQEIISDKTYTLLNGSVRGIAFDGTLLEGSYSDVEFAKLTKGQKILALSMAQARQAGTSGINGSRLQCILGSTADGSAELDEAHFAASVREVLAELDPSETATREVSRLLSGSLPGWHQTPEDLTPHHLCAAVARKVLSASPDRTYLVDSACSSSLYSIALGARALRNKEADLVYAGGVFAPGPANNNLFAQFRGLTPTESRPFDARADGVVFGDGAGILALKRLSDAIDDGDQIRGIIRSEGFSSDGKSPSINVPQSAGQAMAIRSAYARASLDPKSVQFIEAHATATPVGDAVEFSALREAMAPPDGGPRLLGSVKSLIGHTGWTSGVASVIKICKALENRRIPKQYSYDSPNPNIELKGSGFEIPTSHADWPENKAGLPRRAGLNGFGFGGTNAHFVVEEYLEPYHKALADRFRGKPAVAAEVVIVGAEGRFPENGRSFERSRLQMPKKRLVLPDVAEHMDASQYLATMAAEALSKSLPAEFLKGGQEIGVTIGLESKTERGVRANERIFLDRLSRIAGAAGVPADVVAAIRQAIMRKVIHSGPYTLPGLMPNIAASRITHTFDWHGPNLVLDRGKGSLAQALDAGIKFVQAGDCQVVLAGGVHAWQGHTKSNREAAILVAFASLETAKKYNLPILARVQPGGAPATAEPVVLDAGDASYCGATGAHELLAAIRAVAAEPVNKTLIWKGEQLMTLLPPTEQAKKPDTPKEEQPVESRGSHAYVQGTPIRNYSVELVETPPLKTGSAAAGRSYLFLTDQPDAWRDFVQAAKLKGLSYTVVTPAGITIPNALSVDTSNEATLNEDLKRLAAVRFDTIVAFKQLSRTSDELLLLTNFAESGRLLDLLFGVCRSQYDKIGAGLCAVATLALGALPGGELDAFTGLFAGFIKSLVRELPNATCKAMAMDETSPAGALQIVSAELEAKDNIAEVAYRNGRRLRSVLSEGAPLHREGEPWVRQGSVVLATGGGRGVTAVLTQHLMSAYGCTVVALGRTDPGVLPENLRSLNEKAFQQYEPQFYREQLAKDRSKKIPELKKLYERYQASHELTSTIRSCRALPGKYEYVQCDINEPSAVDRVVEDLLVRYGRLDMVLHGAGVQVSKAMTRKSVEEFQRIVGTKIGSLGYIYQACHKRGIHKYVHFHILTSAFSYLGNDGQPGYGAANEAMNRLAARLNLKHPASYWSSLGWLGWAGIGMTRGTEYAALAANRRLRGVTREEGQAIFADAMAGPPASPVNILLADGEVAFYGPEITKTPRPATKASTTEAAAETVVDWPVSPEAMPFLSDHVVRGIPTLPGSFIIAMAGDAARKLLPDLKIVQFERTRFLRLVRAYEGRPARLRALAKVVERTGDETVVQVQMLMDFVHKSGRVLGKDLLHTEIYVRMAPAIREQLKNGRKMEGLTGVPLPDPYVMEGSPVKLNGAFRTLKEVVVGRTSRRAEYKLNGNNRYGSEFDYLIPNVILVDAFWRFGTVRANDSGGLSVYVPERCDAMKVFFDYADFDWDELRRPITFQGANPRVEGDVLHVGPIDALDSKGRILLRVEGGVCRKFGDT